MPSLETRLLDLERKFWTGDADFYRKNLDDSCLVAFTEMTGVMSRDAVAETVKDGNRWRDLALEPKGMVEPAAGVAILSYRAEATRASGEAYAAIVSSGYIRRGNAWRMTFHHQTPLAAGKAP